MSRWDRIKLSLAIGVLSFFIQVVFLAVNVQFIDDSTGQFRLGAQFRFKFVDETTRQFVLVSQLRKLPGELLFVAEIASAATILCYAVFGWYYRGNPLSGPEGSKPLPKTAETTRSLNDKTPTPHNKPSRKLRRIGQRGDDRD